MLEIRDLSKRYGSVVALDGTSFRVAPGRIVGFLGPNGAGKTTTMRAIFGLVRPDHGEVRWRGKPIGPEVRARFGYMPEERGLYPKMKVGDQLSYFARLSGLTATAAKEATAAWLQRLGLADRHGARLEELSHGNQQRVQLAAALVHDPELAVLDEPFSGLDPLGVEALGEMLVQTAATGVAVVFSSHQLDLVEDICQDVVDHRPWPGRARRRRRGPEGGLPSSVARDRGERGPLGAGTRGRRDDGQTRWPGACPCRCRRRPGRSPRERRTGRRRNDVQLRATVAQRPLPRGGVRRR